MIEQRLRQGLSEAAERIPVGPANLDDAIGRGQRRRSRRLAGWSAAAILVVAAAALGVGSLTVGTPAVDVLGEPADAREVAVFLCDGRTCDAVTAEQRETLRAELEADTSTIRVSYESKEDAYARFRDEFADQPDLVGSVSPDALPASFRVLVAADTNVEAFADAYRTRAGVEDVVIVDDDVEPTFMGTDPPGPPADHDG